MKLSFGVLARYAETDPESGLINLTGGGVDVFGVRTLPVRFPMAFVLQFRYPEAEAEQSHRITLTIRGPKPLEVVGEPTTFEITPTLGEFHAAGWEALYAVTGTVAIAADSAGPHSISIAVDGAEAGSIPFQVVLEA